MDKSKNTVDLQGQTPAKAFNDQQALIALGLAYWLSTKPKFALLHQTLIQALSDDCAKTT